MAAEISKVNSVAVASVSKVDTIASASIASINSATWNSGVSPFYNDVIDESAMFDSASSSCIVCANGAPDSLTEGTFSVWVKRSKLGTSQVLISGRGANNNNQAHFGFDSSDKIFFYNKDGGNVEGVFTSDAVFRDCSGWYHVILTFDTTLGTNDTAVQVYVNGSKIALTWTDNTVDSDDFHFGRFDETNANIGRRRQDTVYYFDGYMADLHWLDGIHVADATGFGESSSGIWIPKDYAGAYGTMGFKYDFNDSANFGDDVSGNAQDGTATNMGVDHQVSDRPEDNYCTLDTNATRSNITSLLEGGLSPRDAGAAWHSSLGTFLLKTGKWYFEVDVGADADDIKAGIIAAGEYVGDIITADTDPGPIGYVLHCDASGAVYNAESSGGATGDDNLDAPAASDIMTVAIDCDAGKIWFGMKNAGSGHVWGDFGATGVGNPANGTNPSFSSLDFDLYDFVPVIGVNAHSTSMVNFGQRTFSGTQPTGFKALCTSNLTSPTADDPQDDYINVITYEGTGAENAQTGVGFQPDFVWIKNRDTTDPHLVFDDIRGATVHLEPDKTAAEATTAQTLKSFDADGFTLGTDNEVNTNNEDFVAWCLKEQSSFFDMVSYTGSGAAHTESHDLGVVPEMMIVKNRDQADSWTVYHKAALNKTDPETDRGLLDTTGAWSDAATIWNDTAPTSAVFTVGTAHNVNANNEKYIAYLFASIAGLSKVFAYEGNGNAAGPYVYCGFRPNWILIKDVDSVANWFMFNTAVNTYNPVSNSLKASVTDAEASGTNAMDIHANGFKITHNNDTWSINGNNKTIVGIAFAEQPFNYANAR